MKLRFVYLFYLMPLIVFGYLFWQNTKPVLDIEYIPGKPSATVSDIVPLSRIGETRWDVDGRYKIINKEPVYLDVSLPRRYDKVDVEVEYSDLSTSVFELGVSRDETRKNFDFISLENNVLDNLGWEKIEEGGLTLYQRNKKYNSINDFLAMPFTFKDTIVYRADIEPRIVERWQVGESVINFPVKKSIQMMVYHLGGELQVEAEANEEYYLNIFHNKQTIGYRVPNSLERGVYKIELSGSDSLVFNQIKINSPYLAILNNINIGKLNNSLKLYFATSRLLFRTEYADGLQTLNIDNQSFDIEESFAQYEKSFDNRWLKQVVLEKGNLEIGGTLIFLNDKNLFYPVYEKFYPNINLDNDNFILTSYVKGSMGSFDIKNTPTPYNKLRFLLSLPGGQNNLVKIRGIKFHFIGEKFSIGDIFNKIINKITKR